MDIIQDFSSSVGALGISETPSIHAVKVHIQYFMERNGDGSGLGIFSEQASESVNYGVCLGQRIQSSRNPSKLPKPTEDIS